MSDVAEVANAAGTAVGTSQDKLTAVQKFMEHHAANSNVWAPFPGVHIPLPFVHVPLPQFLVDKGVSLDFNVSVHWIMLLIVSALLLLAFGVSYRKKAKVQTGLANMLEFFVVFIRDTIAIPNLGEEDGRKMTPLLCSFFFFIATTNLLGLIPCFSTATSNLGVTIPLATITFFFMVFGAMWKNGVWGFFKGFIPHGVPWPVLLLMVPVEIIGLGIKGMALSIRLFANMLAGHFVVFALLGLIVTFGAVALPAMVLAMGIYVLEVFVAIFQAFIFTLLSAVFIGQRYHPAH